jgi:hypothetical protein
MTDQQGKFISDRYALMRHAECEENRLGLVVPTERGIRSTAFNVEQLVEKLREMGTIDKVHLLHSPDLKAVTTAVIEEAELKKHGIRVTKVESTWWLGVIHELSDQNIQEAIGTDEGRFVLMTTHSNVVEEHVGWQRRSQAPNSAIYARDFRIGPSVS